ncbi:Sugar transporter [Popillia japonica]|uniref:Sugar transporter n=1 Tax=Popillia japonica TaxID=7064 RepID=A0AAW1LSN0_POPJA
MGVFTGNKVKMVKNSDSNGPQIIALVTASIISFSAGSLYAYASPAIPKLLTDYNFTIQDTAYFPIIPAVAMLVSTPIGCKLADKIGRKRTLLIAGMLHILSWLLIALARTSYVIYISRIFFGIADAGMMAALPAYIAEVSTPKVRSLYGNIMVISSFIGQFVANCIGYYLSISVAGFAMMPIPILFVIAFSFMPETPYYLIMSGTSAEAMNSLQKLRGYENVKAEFIQISLDVHRQLSESGRFKDLFLIKSNRKALIIAVISRCFQTFSGSNCIAVYSQYIFQEVGGNISNGVAGMIVSGLFAVVNPFANIICDKLAFNIVNLSVISWFPVVGLATYSVTFCLGLGVVPTLFLGEIFSTNIRRYGSAVTNVVVSANFCVALQLFPLLSGYGMWVPFLVFGLCCLIASVGSWFIIPETKGKTLEEIQQMLKGTVVKGNQTTKSENVL